MKNIQIEIDREDCNWTAGRVNGNYFEIKHYDEPSEFGIDEGRISKLWVSSKVSFIPFAAYDRGWDRLPRTDNEIEMVMALIDRFN